MSSSLLAAAATAPAETLTGIVYGHAVRYDDAAGIWLWEDSGQPVTPVSRRSRVCPHCRLRPTVGDHDPCLGTIPGATGACCGHGRHIGYITWPGIGVDGGWFKGARVDPATYAALMAVNAQSAAAPTLEVGHGCGS